MAKKKFYEQKSWTYTMCAIFFVLILIIALFVVAPAIAPAGSPFDDFDLDGQPNWLDLDDDNDGIPDGSDPNPYDYDETGDDDDDDDDDDTAYWVTIELQMSSYDPAGGDAPGNPYRIRSNPSGSTVHWESNIFEPVTGPSEANMWYWDLYIYKLPDGSQMDGDPADGDWSSYMFWDFDLATWVEGGEFVIHPPSASCVLGTSELGLAMKNGGGTIFKWGEATSSGIVFTYTFIPGAAAYIYADSICDDEMGSVYAYHIIEINWGG